MSDFFDFRTAPKPQGGFIGATDLSRVALGQPYESGFAYAYNRETGSLFGTIIVRRRNDGGLEASTDVEGYEPVLEGELLVGLRFPGCDRYPYQPWDQECDG
jgi:hypothetical protein